MKVTKNSLIRSESPEALHKRLLKISLWDSLNENRKTPMSFALKINPTSAMVHGCTRLGGDRDVVPPSMNRVLAVEYMTRHRA